MNQDLAFAEIQFIFGLTIEQDILMTYRYENFYLYSAVCSTTWYNFYLILPKVDSSLDKPDKKF